MEPKKRSDEDMEEIGSDSGELELSDGAGDPGAFHAHAPVSGLYRKKRVIRSVENDTEDESFAAPLPEIPSAAGSGRFREELRLDVDRRYPQMTASGTVPIFIASRLHWIAKLTETGPDSWEGPVWFKDPPNPLFPYTKVEIEARRSVVPFLRRLKVVFSGGGGVERTVVYRYRSRYFHDVEFEFDRASNVDESKAVTAVDTHAHPNRPPALPSEELTINRAFRRAGFDVRESTPGVVPIGGAGSDAQWSDAEMHDAMQLFWSRFDDKAQWAMWVFMASLHESGTGLGGIMFDDIGPNHRQGTAIFEDAFIADPPVGDANPAAWVRRMRFWTAVHEMGHAFNLAHSWQKSLGAPWGSPWIPLADEPEARSFMNYPFGVIGGQETFFSDFGYRFSDGELLFMRHAPEAFVQQGNADWFDHHGFEQANVAPDSQLQLIVRANRQYPVFEFLEPVVLELKLKNVSQNPVMVPTNALANLDGITVIIKKRDKGARSFLPYAHYCTTVGRAVLDPGKSLYESLFLSAGLNGWDLAEPGNYTIQVALHLGNEDVVSQPLNLRVTPPRAYEEEVIAQDFVCDEVGRILTFDGSRFLEDGNRVLQQAAEELAGRRVATHAQVALGMPLAKNYLSLELDPDGASLQAAGQAGGKVRYDDPDQKRASTELIAALTSDPVDAAETLGHIDYKYYVDRYCDILDKQGDAATSASLQTTLYDTLSTRNVADWVLKETKSRRDSYKKGKKAAG